MGYERAEPRQMKHNGLAMHSNFKRFNMINLKDKINKTATFRELKQIADNRYEQSWQPELQKDAFIDGAEALLKLLRIGVVSVPKGTLSDFEKWLDKKGNESYCGLPSQYVLDKYKSLNAL